MAVRFWDVRNLLSQPKKPDFWGGQRTMVRGIVRGAPFDYIKSVKKYDQAVS